MATSLPLALGPKHDDIPRAACAFGTAFSGLIWRSAAMRWSSLVARATHSLNDTEWHNKSALHLDKVCKDSTMTCLSTCQSNWLLGMVMAWSLSTGVIVVTQKNCDTRFKCFMHMMRLLGLSWVIQSFKFENGSLTSPFAINSVWSSP